jgi:putative SOS response-associated peptidase YedK
MAQCGPRRRAFTIITTDPNTLVGRIHNRMPVIYDEAMGRQWLEHSFGFSFMTLAAVMRPWPSEYMEAHDISTLVNSPDNNSMAAFSRFCPGNQVSRSCRCKHSFRALTQDRELKNV